jgi:hypothetical protein
MDDSPNSRASLGAFAAQYQRKTGRRAALRPTFLHSFLAAYPPAEFPKNLCAINFLLRTNQHMWILMAGWFDGRVAGLAQACLLASEARGDAADIGISPAHKR